MAELVDAVCVQVNKGLDLESSVERSRKVSLAEIWKARVLTGGAPVHCVWARAASGPTSCGLWVHSRWPQASCRAEVLEMSLKETDSSIGHFGFFPSCPGPLDLSWYIPKTAPIRGSPMLNNSSCLMDGDGWWEANKGNDFLCVWAGGKYQVRTQVKFWAASEVT